MASPAELAQILPDTLPADFSEWDSEDSQAAPPAGSSVREAAREHLREPMRGIAVVSKPAPQSPAQSQAQQHGQQGLKPTLPHPELFTTPQVVIAPALHELREVDMPEPSTIYVDDDGYFKRLKSVTPAVEKPASAPQQAESAAVEFDEMRNTVSLEEELMRTAGKSASRSFRSKITLSNSDDTGQESNKRVLIVAATVGTVLLGVFQLFHSGVLGMARHMADPHAAATHTQPAPGTPKTPPAASLPAGAGAAPATNAAPVAAPIASMPPATGSPTSAPAAAQQKPAAATKPQPAPPPVQSQMMHDQLTAPNVIPQKLKTVAAEEAPPSSGFGDAGMESLGSNGSIGSVLSGQARPNVKAPPPKFVAISAGVAIGLLIKRTEPVYPPIAKTARVSGTVVLQATITKTGAVANVRAVSGPAMLRQAALEAVRTWRYKPYKLNNEPIDVETTVNVIFSQE